MRLGKKEVARFQNKILTWFAKNKRDLPWRDVPSGTSLEDRAYRVLVSEVMLQQTQVSRVIPKYEAWLAMFPDVQSLAQASTRDVLQLWSGLGYNRRALHLQKAARILFESGIKNHELSKEKKVTDYWPRTIGALKKLPGIGEYTARAIACFAFGKPIAVVDTNVRKVILLEVSKETKETKGAKGEKEIQEIADRLLPKKSVLRLRSGQTLAVNASVWNQALMDYASAVLKREKIPIPKQSRFVGSNRYYRGEILKLLLKHGSLTLREARELLHDEFSSAEMIWLMQLLSSLQKEGFIRLKNNTITLQSDTQA